MGNSLLREDRRQQNTQEMPWNVRMQSPKQRTSRKTKAFYHERCVQVI
ncbi:GCSAM isoform 7 [Pan troglodytes]|uniref:GCSAM isoform 3 n=1 Tax=Pan troglodytes TaxID=9598 RepID=A0A2J8MX92_PANTR|nr:GCSAM isoform 3 [Pan troglodytes]PNI64131.1 GCSAM isoform 7 [Pan troglodytes]